MARPREFDEDEVLERALEAFWRRGYDATSISDLLEATGLAKGSLYKAFGDKKSLMLRALERYLERSYGHVRAVLLDAPTAGDGIEAWLLQVADRATQPASKGCFAVNCTVQTAPHDADVRALVVAHRERVLRLFEDVVARGVERGELREDVRPAVAARLIGTLVNGLQVSGKAGLTSAQARDEVELALAALR